MGEVTDLCRDLFVANEEIARLRAEVEAMREVCEAAIGLLRVTERTVLAIHMRGEIATQNDITTAGAMQLT